MMTKQVNSPKILSGVPLACGPMALFLDVDGTLLEFAATPTAVSVDAALPQTLARLQHALGGALALVSGRAVADVDQLFAPLRLPVAGAHGCERRRADGSIDVLRVSEHKLADARRKLQQLVRGFPNLLLEDKVHTLAVHFRGAPLMGNAVRRRVRSIVRPLAPAYEVLEGNAVVEIRPAARSKSTAIEAYLREPPFVGRTPIFIGDDVTDLDGFAAVLRHDGIAIAVGDRISAPYRLADPMAVRCWLADLVAADLVAQVKH